MRKFSILASLLVVLTLVLSACGADTGANNNSNPNANANQNFNGNLNGGLNENTNGDLNANGNLNANSNTGGLATVEATAAADTNGNLNGNTNANDNGGLYGNTNANGNGALETPMAAPTMAAEPTMMATAAVTQPVSSEGQLPVTGSSGSPALVSNLQGYPVYDQTGQKVGDVNAVILDMSAERVAYVVVGLGGFLGLGEHDVAIPFPALEICAAGMGGAASGGAMNGNLNANGNFNGNANGNLNDNGNANASLATSTPYTTGGNDNANMNGNANLNGNANMNGNANSNGSAVPGGLTVANCATLGMDALVLRVPADVLKNAPEADLSAFGGGNGMLVEGWGTQFDTFWADYDIVPSGMMSPTLTTPVPMLTTTTPLTTTPAMTAPVMTAPLATEPMSGTLGTPAAGAGGAVAVGAGLRGLVRASDFIGADLYAGDGSKLATVQDVLIDVATGRVLFAVLDPSDLPGSRLIPVPVRAFSWDPANQRFILLVDAQTLNTAPVFQNQQYPDFALPNWDRDYRFYWDPFLPTVHS